MITPRDATHKWSVTNQYAKKLDDKSWALWQHNVWLWIGDEFSGSMVRLSAGLPTMPEGATHYCPEFGAYPKRAYKHLNKVWSYWTGFDWHVCREPVGSIKRNLIDVRNSAIELSKVLQSLSGDIRQPISASQAAWMAAQLEELGYRKFEIVEEDV
jgi:hypothetical protein